MSRPIFERTAPDGSPVRVNRDAASAPYARGLILAALLLCVAGVALAADKTVSVVETVDIGASASRTWAAIQDFRGWQAWHPAFASTEILRGPGNAKGTVRVLAARDGAKFTEELLSHEDVSHVVQYRIIQSPLPITNYVSSIKVQSTYDGSHVVWSSTFQVDAGAREEDIKKTITGVYRAGLDNLVAVVR
jgi:mxaD protein